MKIKPLIILLSCFSIFAFGFTPTTQANDAQLMTMVKDLQKQMNTMQRTIDLQDAKIRALEAGLKTGDKPSGDFAENLKASIGPADKWLKDLKFSGDLRLRYAAESEHGATNTPDRNRFRYRLRYGFEKEFKGTPFHEEDKFKVGFRLASGTVGGITSTNETFDSQFGFKNISVNRAYATYLPAWAKYTTADGIGLTGLEVTAGKFKNPFANGSTWAIWDGDVEPEGIYEEFGFNLLKSEDFEVKNTTTLGQFVIEEGSGVDHDDAELYAYQTVFESNVKGIMSDAIKLKNAFSFYDYKDFSLPGNFGAAGQNTTSATNLGALAASFSVIDIYNEVTFPINVHQAEGLKLYFDWFKNIAGNGLDVENGGDDKSWSLGAKLGDAKKKGAWQLSYEYAWIEANSTPSVFADSDFSTSTLAGGTTFFGGDVRGSKIGAAYALTDYLSIGLNTFFLNSIAGPDDSERDYYLLDMIWKF